MPLDIAQLPERLKQIKLFLLDLDGTIYLGGRLIPGADTFLAAVRQSGRRHVFLTNNSSRSARAYLERLKGLGIETNLDGVFTSGQSTALNLTAKTPGARVYLLGTASLAEEFVEHGIELVGDNDDHVDYVVVGFDMELTYPRLRRACELIDTGVPFVATHPDTVCPIAGGRYIPDCGAMCEMITHATGKKPVHYGKPNREMVDALCTRAGVRADEVAMVGDRLYTDIALGVNAGATAICVLSGETNTEDIASSPAQPDFVVDSVAAITPLL